MYVRNIGVYKAHGSVGRQVGRYQAVQGAIAEAVYVQGATTEAGFGRYMGGSVEESHGPGFHICS